MKALAKIALVFISLAAISAQAAIKDTQVVNVKLWDQGSTMGISTDRSQVKTGKITFAVENDSLSLVHEMLVVRVVSFDDTLPYDEEKARLYEDRVADFGEVTELEPNQSGELAINLKPGKYLLVCNMPGHYKMKMYSDLVVTP
ncbi:MAG: cupredoxin domain-containing protein [Gammaproteobacteria bacterium]|jgi:uncharacterized cupredoxin-like copper-binding protein|nr:cupredoxin domain-containing protein [Gammaproteobacteria bacterium]